MSVCVRSRVRVVRLPERHVVDYGCRSGGGPSEICTILHVSTCVLNRSLPGIHSPRISRRLQSPAFFQILPTMARHLTHKSIWALTSARSWPASNSLRHCHRVAAASTMGKMTSQGNRERSSTYADSTAQSSCAAARHIWTGTLAGDICCAGDQACSRQ